MDWSVEIFDSVDSTQDLLKDRALSGAPEGTVVQGLEQLKGRGRHGNTWISPKGNLYLSILLRPECPAQVTGQLAFVVALAVGDAVGSFLTQGEQDSIRLKWPNDILYNGLKISGILLETNINNASIDAVYVGVGVNVERPPEGHIGLSDIAGGTVSVDECRAVLLDNLARWYGVWRQKGFAPVREAWLKQAHGIGQPVRARMPRGEEHGIFEGIDGYGALILKQGDEIKTIQAAEIHFGV